MAEPDEDTSQRLSMSLKRGQATPPISLGVLCAAYGLSGACALMYQVVWYHAFVDQLGASATTFLVVLCAFIGGLGLGAVSSARFYSWLTARFGGHGLVNYGRTELVISLSAVSLFGLTRLPLAWLVGRFPYRLEPENGLALFQPTVLYLGIKLVLAVLAVGGPCFLMGLTFPYLCSLFPKHHNLPSRLYAINTLGACVAVLGTEFWGVRVIGYLGCLVVASAGTTGLGLFFLWRGSVRGDGPHEQRRVSLEIGPSIFPGVLSGFLCGGWQALCFVLVKMTLGPTHGVFALLAFFSIFGIWLASTVVHRRSPSRKTLLMAAWGGLGWCVALWWLEPNMTEYLVRFGSLHMPALSPYGAALVTAIGAVGLLIFVPYAAWSMLLPDLCDRQQAAGHNLSLTYGMNTLSFLCGVLVFGWLLQYVHVFFAARVFGVVAVVGLVLLTVSSWQVALPRPSLIIAALAAVAAALTVPRGLEMRLVGGLLEDQRQVIAYRSTPQHLFWVNTDSHGTSSLMFDRHSMSANNPIAQVYMRSMAHLPLLLHRQPKRALLICCGIGLTADAIRMHDSIEQLDVVDLNRSVFLLNEHFAQSNRGVLGDRRLRLVCDDGRQFLDLGEESYELITLEPPPPLQPGISRLYSMDFYRSASRRLTRGGLISQWLPESQMDQRAADLIVATFARSFEHSMMFVGCNRDLILVGSNEPFELASLAERLLNRPRVSADLARLGITSPAHLLARIMRFEEGMGEWLDMPVIRDGFASLETLQVSPVQQLHVASTYQRAKNGLVFDTREVAQVLAEAGVAEAGEVIKLQADPTSAEDCWATVPAIYFPKAVGPGAN